MTHVALVRSALAGLIASVPDVGRVHAYQRFASREAEMKALYVATIAGADLARATTATIRRKLITVPARVASSARRVTLHLPTAWPWRSAWTRLFTHGCGPPAPATT